MILTLLSLHSTTGTPVVGVNGMYQVNDATKGTEFLIPSYGHVLIRLFGVAEFPSHASLTTPMLASNLLFSKQNYFSEKPCNAEPR